jgi:hypothetical protein
MINSRFRALLAIVLILSAPAALFSQKTPWSAVKFEVRTALGYQKSQLESSYLHQYSPPFLSGAYQSAAQQTIRLEGEEAWGMSVGVSYFPISNFGLQLLLDYGKPRIGGQNSDYDFSLNYAMKDPPGSPPYPYVYDKVYVWPTTKGNLTQLCLSLNAATRLPLGKPLAIGFSGGLTYFRSRGSAASVGFTFCRIEDNSFIEETYQIPYNWDIVNKLGFNVGADFTLVITSNLCATMDLRAFFCPKYRVPLEIEGNWQLYLSLEEIKTVMQLGDIAVNPSFYRLDIGLKYLF